MIVERGEMGMVHLYCGEGKGKTTAAAGLALRMAGTGGHVLFVQFYKNGNSSEVTALNCLDTVRTLNSGTAHRRFSNMDEKERRQAQQDYDQLLRDAIAASCEGIDLLVQDEVVSACNHKSVSEEMLLDFLRTRPAPLEVVLTGRDPSAKLLEQADYVTEIRKIRHPYDRGVRARRGIEF